ncbi:ATP-binding cassette domain-containing protein, partial [Paenibacillus whitsoniae]
MTNVVEVQNLTKSYGSVTAVDRVSFSIEANKIYGLLGRNGAGKT